MVCFIQVISKSWNWLKYLNLNFVEDIVFYVYGVLNFMVIRWIR